MAVDRDRVYTAAERSAYKGRCPECRAPISVTWRRARQPGRSEDLYTLNKIQCPNRCPITLDEAFSARDDDSTT